MKKYYAIFALFLLFTTSCNKDNIIPIEKEEITTPENWLATQDVRINKVEFISSANDPYYNDSLIIVNYLYNTNGSLERIQSNINFETEGVTEIFKISENGGNIFIENFSETCLRYNLIGQILADNNIKLLGNRVDRIVGKINTCTFGFIGPGKGERQSKFSYTKQGLLNSINSYSNTYDGRDPILIREINSIMYDLSNAVKSMNVVLHSVDANSNPIKADDLSVSVEYQNAQDVPDGLIRMVNQSILELSALGHEEFVFQQFYVMNFSNDFKRNFSDWVCSFGVPKLQTIAAQNIGLISSKHIKGKKTITDDITGDQIFENVDAVANFPYIHDATAKTLEIAALKIWYELVE